MIDTNELRRLAQAATPGPWEFWHGMIATDIDNDGGVVIAKRPTPSGGKLQARVDTNFQYIVAAYPAASLELLDRLEAAETAWKISDKSCHDLTEKVIPNIRDQLEAVEKERDALRAKVEAMEQQGPVATVRINAINGNPSVDFVPGHRYLHHNDKLYLAPGAQPAQMVVAYLDLGVGGYMDIGTDLTDEALAALPKGKHMLGIIGTYDVEEYIQAQPAPSVPDLLESLRCACNYIDKLGGGSQQYRAMLAAAPEAKS